MNAVKRFAKKCRTMVSSEKGQTMVEYALIVVLIAIAAIVAMKYLGTSVNNTFSKAALCVTQ